ncbi:hypothetical protein B7494_g679 [Chlorociboria aeruginascens]|nr:hypothetical protein B7494_g679 [Chlorociboria aeruginascens]
MEMIIWIEGLEMDWKGNCEYFFKAELVHFSKHSTLLYCTDQSQGIQPEIYPYAYLATATKFLKYSSNPVSIWYLYSSSHDPRSKQYIRRALYLFSSLLLRTPKGTKFTHTKPKDFYVSVFNSRKGCYSLNAYDPFANPQSPTLNTTITLFSENHLKLTARIFSTSPSLDPCTRPLLQKIHFFLTWWWAGLATFPRTIILAVYILKWKKLPWVMRPEPLARTLSRRANEIEYFLEAVFRKYLLYLVENAEPSVVVRYQALGVPDCEEKIMYLASANMVKDRVMEIEMKVLTPTFYPAWVRYTDTVIGMKMEVESGTIKTDLRELGSPFPSLTLKALLLSHILQPFRLTPISRLHPEPYRPKHKVRIS